jgi:hypothetical protein
MRRFIGTSFYGIILELILLKNVKMLADILEGSVN